MAGDRTLLDGYAGPLHGLRGSGRHAGLRRLRRRLRVPARRLHPPGGQRRGRRRPGSSPTSSPGSTRRRSAGAPPSWPTTTASPAARVLDQVGGDEAKARLAAATLLHLPGTPFLYYGEELGMRGAAQPDRRLADPHPHELGPATWSNAGFTTGAPFRALSANVPPQRRGRGRRGRLAPRVVPVAGGAPARRAGAGRRDASRRRPRRAGRRWPSGAPRRPARPRWCSTSPRADGARDPAPACRPAPR